MDLASAPNTDAAASLPGDDTKFTSRLRLLGRQIERFLEAERGQLPLWAVVLFGTGIALWFALPDAHAWSAVIAAGSGLGLAGVAVPGRTGRAMLVGGLLLAAGMGWIWWRAERVAAPRIERVSVERFVAEVERVEPLVAKNKVRLTVVPEGAALPPRLRVTLREAQVVPGIGPGARIDVRARLMPPPTRALPGGYDFAAKAWFSQIGGVGTALGEVEVLRPARGKSIDGVRAAIGAHVRERLPGQGDGIATALATGDKNAVEDGLAEAMRRAGLAHLLAVSGLHIAAVVGATMLLSLKLLALSPRLALSTNLVLVSAAFGAAAGIGYTLLTGMQVPTVRACIAALLVLAGLALGRDSLSLRLVAVGALLIMLVRPEAIAGASFQLSFAAVTAIIVLHANPRVSGWIARREESLPARFGRGVLALLLTGLAVEVTLMPFAFYHFHKAGLYGVVANLFAIPLTTFVVMPLLALALSADLVGAGAPFWWGAGKALDLLAGLATTVSGAEGAVAMVPSMPTVAFALCVAGGLWLFVWRGPVRRWGIVPMAAGLLCTASVEGPDLLVTGDGRHVAIIEGGVPAMLRARSGDFTRDMLSEAAGFDGDPIALDAFPGARCNRDSCTARIERNGRRLDLLALRSRDFMRWRDLVAACAIADVVVADRRLPDACAPRWLKLDRPALERSGGISIRIGDVPALRSVRSEGGEHPWQR
ncbi:ComEC/Rec2 family competence protein [Sphingomicrobium nitratireducens]|uniref:ComEC/Rec2 family competence protein n=1 Tax=Sphingomicrobium nitratireducens TaxID=2964666 RepID=UPI00223FA453|nr:ComEC/Rec2 family competence protein [Sphingomicrobium nitratireducens]